MNDFLPPDFLHDFIHAVIPIANIFGDLRDYMRDFLAWIYSWVGNWGISIIILTVIVRIVIFPLTWKQIRSQMAMQSLSPKIKEIQAKHKGDKARIQQETMRLYQEYRVNPLASCLPLLLQLPIFILLYYSIRNYPPLQHADFLWFTLGEPDPYYILLIIYVVSQLISTELMLTPETPAQQKWMMRAMPLVFVAFLYNFPSGLFVYWITTNLWTIGQTGIVRYLRAHHPVELQAADPNAPRKRNRFVDAMTAAQQQREATGATGSKSAKPGQKQGGGKPGQRPAGKGGKPGQRPPGKPAPGGKPGTAPSGQRPPGKPAAKPRTGDAAGAQSDGGAGGKPAGRPGGKPAAKPAPGQVQTSKTGKRPVKPKSPRPDSSGGS